MNLALAVLAIAAGACRIRVNHLASAESMNTKKTSGIKEVALTFDDGPSPECTKDLLEGLKERNVKATFFVIGEKAEAYPDLIKKIQDDGHIIGNHSYTHVNLGILSKEDACEQIRKTNDAIYQITGEYPVSYTHLDVYKRQVQQLSVDVGIPTKLEALKEEDLEFLAESAFADACAPGNPKDTNVEDLKALFRKLM